MLSNQNMLAPLVPYMVRTLSTDLSPDQLESEIGGRVGRITASFYLPLLVMNVVWGSLSDRIGRKPILLMGLFVCGLTTFILGINTSSFAVALLCRFMAGVFGGNSAVAKGALGEINKTEQGRSWAYAVYSQLYAVFGIVGPLIGGFLVSVSRESGASEYPYLAACGVGALLSVISLVVAFTCFEEPQTDGPPSSAPNIKPVEADSGIKVPDIDDSELKVEDDDDRDAASADQFTMLSWRVLLPILLYVLIAFANMYWGTILPLLFSSKQEMGGLAFSPLDTSFAISVRAISKLFFSSFVSRGIVSTLGAANAYSLGMFMVIPAASILGVLSSLEGNTLWTGVTVSMMLFGFVESLVYLCVMMMISSSVPPSYLGATFGLSSTCAAVMRTLAPPLSGYGWELASVGGYDPWVAFIALQVVAVVSMVCSWVGFSRPSTSRAKPKRD
ncbi:major facilitator superfamily domain-containing protein [Chytriomyces sp. MP71]|nr:major facilitator superfamily domain-containing protein [Chytriomyces sp. MP71]